MKVRLIATALTVNILSLTSYAYKGLNKITRDFQSGIPVTLDAIAARELNLDLYKIENYFRTSQQGHLINGSKTIQLDQESQMVDISSFDGVTVVVPLESILGSQPNWASME